LIKKPEDIHICVNSSDGTHSIERTIPLAEKGFKISFITHNESDRMEELREYKNVRIYLLENINPTKRYNRLHIYTELIKELNPDLIIVHFCGFDRFHSAIYSGIKPIAGILMAGEVDTKNCRVPLHVWFEFKFTRLMLPYIEFLASKTNLIVEKLKSWGLKGKIMHIPWGVKIINNDTKNYDYELIDKNKIKTRRELRLPEDKFILLTNRNVSESGRQIEIVKGFAQLIKNGYNIHMVIIIRDYINSYLEKINEYINKNNLGEFITILDYVPQKKMYYYYESCDVLISNWVYDGLPQTFFEASLRGLPIIMNNLQQYYDFYTDKESALMNDGTTQGIISSVEMIYNNIDLREKLSVNGYKTVVEKANFDKWSECFIDEISLLLDSDKVIKIPRSKIFISKIILLLIIILRRFPFSLIQVRT